MSILVTGSIAYDYLMEFDGYFSEHILPNKLDNLNISFLANTHKKKFGGAGANIAYTLKLLKNSPILVGAIGENDSHYIEHLKHNGISFNFIQKIPEQSTARAYILTDNSENQIACFYAGAMNESKVEWPKDIVVSYAIVAPQNKKIMIDWIVECHNRGVSVIFDPGQALTQFNQSELREVIKLSDFVFVNEYEYGLLNKKLNGGQEYLNSNNVLGVLMDTKIIITYGGYGSAVQVGNSVKKIPAIKPKKIVDPTGAGDAYRAGFLKGLFQGEDLEKCCYMGAVVASFVVEHSGTQEHKFTIEEFKDRYLANN
jgi:adenosine kinase